MVEPPAAGPDPVAGRPLLRVRQDHSAGRAEREVVHVGAPARQRQAVHDHPSLLRRGSIRSAVACSPWAPISARRARGAALRRDVQYVGDPDGGGAELTRAGDPRGAGPSAGAPVPAGVQPCSDRGQDEEGDHDAFRVGSIRSAVRRTVSGRFVRSEWPAAFTAARRSASLTFGSSAIASRQIAAIDCRVISVGGLVPSAPCRPGRSPGAPDQRAWARQGSRRSLRGDRCSGLRGRGDCCGWTRLLLHRHNRRGGRRGHWGGYNRSRGDRSGRASRCGHRGDHDRGLSGHGRGHVRARKVTRRRGDRRGDRCSSHRRRPVHRPVVCAHPVEPLNLRGHSGLCGDLLPAPAQPKATGSDSGVA